MAPPNKQNEAPTVSDKERIAKLEAELAALKKPAVGVVKGTKTYRLAQSHYRKGVLYQPGDLITVTDEKPGKTWVPVEAKAVLEHVEAPKPEKRPSDLSV